MGSDDDTKSAMALIRTGRTLVMATCRGHSPWSAPVYYIYVRPGLYFFSSPRSRHIQETQDRAEVAGAIFVDSHRWQAIEGVQMTGHVNETIHRTKQLSITGRYLVKFPLARDFLSSGGKNVIDLRDKVRLYCFSPTQIHYVNNRQGFGRRVLIETGASDQEES